jgi:hypothetical protein
VLGTGDIRAVVGRAVHIQVSVSPTGAPGVVEKGYSDIMGPAAPIALNRMVRMTRGVERVSRLDAANLSSMALFIRTVAKNSSNFSTAPIVLLTAQKLPRTKPSKEIMDATWVPDPMGLSLKS